MTFILTILIFKRKKILYKLEKSFKNPYRYENRFEKSTSNNNERIKILEKERLFKVRNYELLFISTFNIFTYLFAPFTFFQIFGNLLLQNDILLSFFSRFRGEPFILLVLICLIEWLIFIIYFAPSNIAWVRKHPNRELIFVLNICLGWTGIGCIILYIWATKSFNEFSN